MNQDQIKGKWNQLKGEIKKKWARMTDDDLLEVEGDMDKVSGRIQERSGPATGRKTFVNGLTSASGSFLDGVAAFSDVLRYCSWSRVALHNLESTNAIFCGMASWRTYFASSVMVRDHSCALASLN